MELRLIEIIVPTEHCERLQEKLSDLTVIEQWTLASADDQRRVWRLLVGGQAVDDVLQRLEPFAERVDDFRVNVYQAQATLPSLEDSRQGNGEEEDANGEANEQRISRSELYEGVSAGARCHPQYLLLVVLSTVVAAIGLERGNVAVIVGAMVIAPLLGPNTALALAVTLADLPLARRAIATGMAGVALAVIMAVIVAMIMPVSPDLPELANRTQLQISDVALALAAGGAGALAVTSGAPAALVGVMVAVALLPPLAAAAMLAAGGHWLPAMQAGLLFAVNVVAINLAGIATFLFQGYSPRRLWEARRARRVAWVAITFWGLLLGGFTFTAFVYLRH
ncbi:MAG: TIGR00341 family protein [Wenzhouxiangellaceae bacterium]